MFKWYDDNSRMNNRASNGKHSSRDSRRRQTSHSAKIAYCASGRFSTKIQWYFTRRCLFSVSSRWYDLGHWGHLYFGLAPWSGEVFSWRMRSGSRENALLQPAFVQTYPNCSSESFLYTSIVLWAFFSPLAASSQFIYNVILDKSNLLAVHDINSPCMSVFFCAQFVHLQAWFHCELLHYWQKEVRCQVCPVPL